MHSPATGRNADFYVQFPSRLEGGRENTPQRRLQLGAGSRLLIQSLGIQLVQEAAVELDGRRTLQFEAGRIVSKVFPMKRKEVT